MPDPAYLQISGSDRVDFMPRQTTNDLILLSRSCSLVGVLTSPTALILDILALFIGDQSIIRALTLPGHTAQTISYLQDHIFFMDNVSVSDASAEFPQIEQFGPKTGSTMTTLDFSIPPEKNLITTSDLARSAKQGNLTNGIEMHLLVPVEGINSVLTTLIGTHALPLKKETFSVLQIETGLPAAGKGPKLRAGCVEP